MLSRSRGAGTLRAWSQLLLVLLLVVAQSGLRPAMATGEAPCEHACPCDDEAPAEAELEQVLLEQGLFSEALLEPTESESEHARVELKHDTTPECPEGDGPCAPGCDDCVCCAAYVTLLAGTLLSRPHATPSSSLEAGPAGTPPLGTHASIFRPPKPSDLLG